MKNSCPEMCSAERTRVRISRPGVGHKLSSAAEAQIVVFLPTEGYLVDNSGADGRRLTCWVCGDSGFFRVQTLLSRVDLWGKEAESC